MTMYRMIVITVTVFFEILVGYLFLLAGLSTTAIDALEHSYLVKDHILLQLFLAAAFIVACTFFYTRSRRFQTFVSHINGDQTFSQMWRRRLLLILLGFSIAVLLILQKIPRGDQRFICDMANSMMNGDYYGFDRGQYLDMYPNQIGMVLLLYGFAHIAGSYNYLLFQFLNAVALVVIYHDMAEISDETGHSRFTGFCIIILGCVFLPAILYTTFVYGTLIGLAFILRALRHLRHFLTVFTHNRREMADQLGEFLLLCTDAFMAVTVKTNFQIFVIALIIYTWLVVLQIYASKKKVRSEERLCNGCGRNGRQCYNQSKKVLAARALIATLMLITVLMLTQRVLNKAAGYLTGRDISDGLSPWSWAAMGLQENAGRYDGWYNGYGPGTYLEANSSGERQKSIVQENMVRRMEYFWNHPMNAVHFFCGKNASQWNNPDFQSFWVVNHARHNIQYSGIINAALSPDGIARTDVWLNFLQFMILAGAFLFAFSGKNKKRRADAETSFYELCMIGGFLFYSIWEAKAQYTLSHFMCLLPLAAYGYEETVPELIQVIAAFRQPSVSDRRIKGKLCQISRAWIGMLILACALLAGRGNTLISAAIVRDEDTKSYERYLQDHRYVRLEHGGLEELNERFTLSYSHYDNHCYLIADDGRALTADDTEMEEDENRHRVSTELSECVYSSAQSWYVRSSEEVGQYYLIHTWNETELALTKEDSGEIVLCPFDGTAEQRWEICGQ